MASEPADTVDAPKPKQFSRWRIALAIFVACILLLLAACGWLLGAESGARSAFSALNALSSGAVQAEGIRGRLAGAMQIDRLSLETANRQVTLKNIRLDWQPSALWRRTLHIDSLRIGYLAVIGNANQPSEPLRMPDNIALPFKLQIDQAQLDGGEIGVGPITIVQLGGFAFNADFDGMRYRLGVDRLAARSAAAANPVSGNVSGQATLSAVKPYALAGRFSSAAETVIQNRPVGISSHIGIDGSLAELSATVDLSVDKAKANGHAIVRPFTAQPLGNANLAAKALDLSLFDPALPRTLLDIDLSVAERGAGELTLTNAAAGLYSDNKIPLADLRMVFRQDGGRFDFNRIAATLGSAGRPAGAVNGSGRYADGALTLALTTGALDLQRLDQRLRPTKLAGNIDLRHAAGKQEFSVALTEPLKKNKLALAAHATLAEAALTIDRAELRVRDGVVSASGRLDLARQQSFSAQGKSSRFRLQDVGNFAQLPDLVLNGEFSLSGMRLPQLQADLAFRIADSRLAGQPLQGEGNAQLRADKIIVPKLLLMAGANRLSMQGELSARDARLTFALTAPKLEQLGPGFGGAIDATGNARGSVKTPHVSAEWKASNVRVPGNVQIGALQGKAEADIDSAKPFFISAMTMDATGSQLKTAAPQPQQLASFSAQVRFAPQPNAPLMLELRGQGLAIGALRVDRFSAGASGTTAQHALNAALNEPGQSWTLAASGGLRDLARAPQWQGAIDRLDAAGRFTAHLAAPAPLLLSQQKIQLDRFRLNADSATIAIEQFSRSARSIATRGRVERLQVASLLQLVKPAPPVTTDLQIDGEWNLEIADTVSGSIQLQRQRGDVVMRGNTPVALGLRKLEATATATGGRVSLRLTADGQKLGQLELDAGLAMGSGANRLSIAPNAAVSGRARIDIPTLGWAGPLLSPTLIADGRLQSAISIGGTVAEPRLAGQIFGSGLRLFFTDSGVDLRQGALEGAFQDAALLIKTLRFQSDDGSLAIAGPIDLAGGKPTAQLSLDAVRFRLLNRSDRRLVVSGNSRIGLANGRATVTGAFTVNSGFFDLGQQGAPALSDDVVIVGRTEKPAGQLAAALDISVALGDGIVLKGRGLNASLAGQIRLLNAAGEPLQAQGTLRVAKGTYTAYGRELAIERGLLRFSGPINNPALDILAMRRGQQVEAGVTVLGTVLAPRIALFSEPTVTDAEKLSWLVLGRGLDTAGGGDAGALQAAAGALLSQGAAAGVQSQLAAAFGLDSVSFGASDDSVQQRIVKIGKQISSRLYASYQQGLESASSALLLRYTVSPKLTLEVQAGARSALSLFYNFAFD
jgi:translocation and assembly module TamB